MTLLIYIIRKEKIIYFFDHKRGQIWLLAPFFKIISTIPMQAHLSTIGICLNHNLEWVKRKTARHHRHQFRPVLTKLVN